jgi:hypothetical protein
MSDQTNKQKVLLDFIIANENNETVKCSFRKLFEYNGDMYVAFEDNNETIHILKIKDPYSNTPKLVEIPKEHRIIIRNVYKALIGERPLYVDRETAFE